MSTTILAAAAAAAQNAKDQYGFFNALNQGGVISWTVAVILTLFLFFSFYIMFTKLFEQQKIMNQAKRVRANFWNSNSLREGSAKLEKNSAYKQIVDDGLAAQEQHARLTDPVEAHDWLHGSLARSEATINSQLGGGLAFLATVCATAPFIGLFGTVLGIIKAFADLSRNSGGGAGAVMAGISEALVATAVGLMVAIPAVIAFNFFQAQVRKTLTRIDAIAHMVLATFTKDEGERDGTAPVRAEAKG